MTNSNEKTYALFSNPTNKKIIAELEKEGAKVFQFSPLITEKTVLDEKSVADIKNLNAFDWIIFPDVLTVDYFLQVLEENGIDLFEIDSIQVCAFGEAVADCLRFVQLHADVIPNSVEAASVFLALLDYIGKDKLCNLKFLLPKEISQEFEIKGKLIESRASVVELPIYQAKISTADETAKLKALLKGGAIDEFIFSLPTDLIALKHYFNNKLISTTLSEINISTVDKAMFQTLKEHDLKADYFRLK
ncbi:MAG TPA: uroporphyrinogen-III synthase [Pyrinomonadaceae bacterium]|nr:uroporphyrinogen-III synthase [Pyrinomonadaceae bacterium]